MENIKENVVEEEVKKEEVEGVGEEVGDDDELFDDEDNLLKIAQNVRPEMLATEEEIKTGKRFFNVLYNDVNVELSVRKPNNKEMEIADWEFSRFFNKAITQGIIPEGRMLEILKEQGVWTDKNEKDVQDMQNEVAELESELREINDDTRDYDKAQKVKSALKEIRNKLWIKRITKQQYLTHTAENKAEEHRNKVLVSLITEYASGPKKGKPFFKDLDSMLDFENQALVATCLVNYMTLANGLASNFLENAFLEDKVQDWEIEAQKEQEEKSKKTTSSRGRPKKQ